MKTRIEKKNITMKKVVLSLVFVFAMVVSGQSQIFVMSEDGATGRDGTGVSGSEAIIPLHSVEYDQEVNYVPLGSGILALAGLGIGYALAKKRKQEK